MSSAQEKEGAQRRQAVRKIFRSDARFVTDGNLYTVRTFDLSTGGASIISTQNPAPNSICLLELHLPIEPHRPTVIHVWVRVAYSFLSPDEGGFKIGLQFKDLNPNDMAALIKFLK